MIDSKLSSGVQPTQRDRPTAVPVAGPTRVTSSPPTVERDSIDQPSGPVARLQAFRPATHILLAVAGTVICWEIDVATGPEFSVLMLYLFPVFLATWFLGRTAGVLVSILAAAAWASIRLQPGLYTHTATPWWNLGINLALFLTLAHFFWYLRQNVIRLALLATSDPLTQLPNRRRFFELAQQELHRAQRHGRPMALLYFDLDGFKALNDRFGHARGDEALCVMGAVLRSSLRPADIVARLGGDEFVVLLPETHAPDAHAIADRLHALLAAAFQHNALPLDVSIGVAVFPDPPVSVDALLQAGDERMYAVKRARRRRLSRN